MEIVPTGQQATRIPLYPICTSSTIHILYIEIVKQAHGQDTTITTKVTVRLGLLEWCLWTGYYPVPDLMKLYLQSWFLAILRSSDAELCGVYEKTTARIT